MGKISILGAGWFGSALGATMAKQGWAVQASTTTPDKRTQFAAAGMHPVLLQMPCNNGNASINLDPGDASFWESDILLLAFPPRIRGGADPDCYAAQMRAILAAILPAASPWLIMISSTGVMPNKNRKVKESDIPSCYQDSPSPGILQAERVLQAQTRLPVTILRFGGLFGPGRNLAAHFAGRQHVDFPKVPVNLIHLDDCIGATLAIIEKNLKNEVFNIVTDGHPSRGDYYTRECIRQGLPAPTWTDTCADWKMIDNSKFKAATGYVFQHTLPLGDAPVLP